MAKQDTRQGGWSMNIFMPSPRLGHQSPKRGDSSKSFDSDVPDLTEINSYIQSKAKSQYGSVVATLRECCNDKKIGSKAKHALKDLTFFRPSGSSGSLLILLLSQLNEEDKISSKDERKVLRLLHFLLCRYVEEFPDQANQVLSVIERGSSSSKSAPQRMASYRSMGCLARHGGAEGHVVTMLAEQLEKAADPRSRMSILGALKRFSVKDDSSSQERFALAASLYSGIRACGRTRSAPAQIVLAGWRFHDVMILRHVLALMLEMAPVHAISVLSSLLEVLSNPAHVKLILSDSSCGVFLVRLIRWSKTVQGGGDVAPAQEEKAGGIVREIAQTAQQILQGVADIPSDRIFLELLQAFDFKEFPSNSITAVMKRFDQMLRSNRIPQQTAACRYLKGFLCDNIEMLASRPELTGEIRTTCTHLLFSRCSFLRCQAMCVLVWLLPHQELTSNFLLQIRNVEADKQSSVVADEGKAGGAKHFFPKEMISQLTTRCPEEAAGRLDPILLADCWKALASMRPMLEGWRRKIVKGMLSLRERSCPRGEMLKLQEIDRIAIWSLGRLAPLLLCTWEEAQGEGEATPSKASGLRADEEVDPETGMATWQLAGTIALQFADPVRISVYEHLVDLTNEEGYGLMGVAASYLAALDEWYDAVQELEEGRVLVDVQGLSARQRGWLSGIRSQLLAFS
ncbi:hypothetical protein GUITHDRAFT_138659 [Guillardia theta CCMP2712]|uniref:Uncharacterized protein n=1 Tax=Guillardia theta (strain CCMP2712) TaxID=905079 RepID=L1JB94_GUITC|nr:hypothetical protein GUITHDRAFT_138659 [Guillardia theta CCMP2712]EKX45798.1 hypothetical protein GUITHDRAFT_138659 [Guillardia theta CCMP2712]|eukprot:XP_005832778.1 hypothetical protein GUITHDRAFT_138659 [Guillardia theta CCMP2712]